MAMTPDIPGMDVPPHRLCCGQPHFGAVCPDGMVMCCICFFRYPVTQLHVDPVDGRPMDICKDCAKDEQKSKDERS
jgi:hypothetical protein